MNHDDTQQADPLDHPELATSLSQPLRDVLRRVDDGDEAARTEALPAVAAIVDAFAALGLIEFAYLAVSYTHLDVYKRQASWRGRR